MNIYRKFTAYKFVAVAVFIALSTVQTLLGQALQAKFYVPKTTECGTSLITFSDQSTGNIDSWVWDFDRGTSPIVYDKSENPNPAITFTPGEYNVKLTVKSGKEESSFTQKITVYEKPTVKFSLSDFTGCINSEFQFVDESEASATISNYTWSFGDGNGSSEKSPKHTYVESGKYSIGLTVMDIHGCSATENFMDYLEVSVPLSLNVSASSTQACSAPLTTIFTPTIGGGTAETFSWNFGDGESSTEKNPEHTYTADGSYNVVFAATNSTGCESKIQKDNFININTFDANFSTNGTLCTNSEISFNGTANMSVNSWEWDFGDGTTGSGATVGKTYASSGTYNVKLTAKNAIGCVFVKEQTIVINTLPSVSISADKTHLCEESDRKVQFTDNSTGGVSWLWDFGDETQSTSQNPEHTYEKEGVYEVTLSFTDASSCTATSDALTIKIQNPLASFALTSDDNEKFCLGTAVTITDESSSEYGIVSADFEFNYDISKETSHTESGKNKTIVYSERGIYPITLSVIDNDGCVGEMKDTVKIGEVPVQPTISTENKCYKDVKEDGLDFEVTPSDDATEWFWDFGDGQISIVDGNMVNHIYEAPKDYSVSVIAKDYHCPSEKATKDIIVKEPAADFIFTPGAVCEFPGTITFDPSPSKGAKTFLWNFGDEADNDTAKILIETLEEEGHYKWTNKIKNTVIVEDTTTNIVVHTYAKSNKYNVTLVTTADECTDDKANMLNLSGITPGFTQDTIKVCLGTPIQFSDTSKSSFGAITERQWTFGEDEVTVSSADNAYTFNESGTFSVSLKVVNQYGCKDSLEKAALITVYPLPKVMDFNVKNEKPYSCADFDVYFKSSVQPSGVANIVEYQWAFGDGAVSTEKEPMHTYKAGEFDVTLKVVDEKNCSDDSTKTKYIISSAPLAKFNIPNIVCSYTDVSPTNSSTGYDLKSTWDWGDGSAQSTETAPTHSYQDVVVSDTSFEVTLSVVDTIGCSNSSSKNIIIRHPVANFGANDSIFTCPPADVFLQNKSTGTNLTYSWNLPSSVENPFWQFYTSGDYDISLTVTDDAGCKNTAMKPAYIEISGPRGKIDFSKTEACSYDTIQFYGRDIVGATTITWVYDDGRYDITENVDSSEYRYSSGGEFIPSMVLADDNGCKVTVTGQKLTVYHIIFDFIADSILCEPSTVAITNTSTEIPTEADSWQWAFSTGDTLKTKDATLDFDYGIFNLSLTSNIKGCIYQFDSTSFLKVLRRLNADFSISENPAKTMETVVFTNETDTAFGLPVFTLWDYGTGATSDEFDGSYSYMNYGDFNVTLKTYIHEQCPNTLTLPITVLKEYLIPNVFTPNGDGINDMFLEDMPEVDLIILNRWGQKLYDGKGGWNGMCNGENMSAGTYYYIITLPSGEKFEGPLMLIRN